MSESEEEDHEYAMYGTLLDPIEEDEVQARKPISVQDQVATDKHGKRRFHGAFTGGFSAGFCNTVGSLEGWTPSTFKSSRAEKATSKLGEQKPEDFMDEEDLSEFGIAPKSIQISSSFEGNSSVNRSRKLRITEGETIPGVPVLETLLQPVLDTIGSKLLRRMGWKPGQGVGPRLTARDKQAMALRETSRPKVYGCAGPDDRMIEQAQENRDPEGSDLVGKDPDDDSEDVNDECGFTYAPDEYLPYLVKPKDNEFGLGYKGLDRTPVLSDDRRGFSLFDVDTVAGDVRSGTQDTGVTFIGKNNKKVKIHGQAFGVGAFEAEDEDIYAVEDMSRYDLSLAPSGSRSKPRDSQFKPREVKAIPGSGSDGTLAGFRLSSSSSVFTKVFPPPVLPPNYVPRPPTFSTAPPASSSQATPTADHPITKARSAFERAAILDEPLPIVPLPLPIKLERPEVPSDGDGHRGMTLESSERSSTSLRSSTRFSQDDASSQSHAESSQGQSNSQGQMISQGQIFKDASLVQSQEVLDGKAFRPFASEPEKQKRYEQFVVFLKLGMKEKLSDLQPKSMTEWERQREAAEFTSAHALYTPLSGAMADRFTRGSQPDDTNPLVKVEKSMEPGDEVLKNAAKNKMFGKLTREITVWVPCDLLCKRFNIKPPVFDYRNPSSAQAQKKRRNTNYSLFEFLNAPSNSSNFDSSSQAPSQPESDQHRLPLKEKEQGVSKSGEKEKLPNPFREDVAEVSGHTVAQSSTLEDIPLTEENKVDLFRAIFLSSDEEDELEEKDKKSDDQRTEEAKEGTSQKVDTGNEETEQTFDHDVGNEKTANNADALVDNTKSTRADKDDLKNKSCDKSKDINNPMKLIDQELQRSNRDSSNADLQNADESYGPRIPENLPEISAGQSANTSSKKPSNKEDSSLNTSVKNANDLTFEEPMRVSKIRNSEVVGVRFEKPTKSLQKLDGKTSKPDGELDRPVDKSEAQPVPMVSRVIESILPVTNLIADDESEWVDADAVSDDENKTNSSKQKLDREKSDKGKRKTDKDRSDSGKQKKKKRKKKENKLKRSCSPSSCSDVGKRGLKRHKITRRKDSSSSSEDKKRHKSKRKRYSSSSAEDKRHKSKKKYSGSSEEEKRGKSKRKYSSSSEEEKRRTSKRKYSSSSEEEKRHESKKKHKKIKGSE